MLHRHDARRKPSYRIMIRGLPQMFRLIITQLVSYECFDAVVCVTGIKN